MSFGLLTDLRYLVCVFLFAWLLVSCVSEEAESDCLQVQQEITTFTKKMISPLVDSQNPSKIEQSVVTQLKRLRNQVVTCARPPAWNNTTNRNVDFFDRIAPWLGFIEMTLEFVLEMEEDDPELARMLISTPTFRETVLDIETAIDLERQQ